MQEGKTTIQSMLDGLKIFNIPIYQRSYAWEKKQLEEFYEDLVYQIPENPYFFGTFLLHIKDKKNEFKLIDVVDGQQRLTTFIIFMNELINIMQEKSCEGISIYTFRNYVKDGEVYKLETENEGSSFLHNVILGNQPFTDNELTTKSKTLLLGAKKFFKKGLKDLNNETLGRIYQVATESVVLLYVVNEIGQATQIFELLNDRGRKLTDLEALKSFLMYSTGSLVKNPDQLIKNIQDNFSMIYRKMEKYEINGKDILRYHSIAFESIPADKQDNAKQFIKDKLNNLIKTDKEKAIKEINDFTLRLKDSFNLYAEIQEIKFKNRNLSELYMIGRVNSYYPLLMKVYKEENEKFDTLIEKLKAFTLRASIIGLRSNAGESYLYTALRNDSDVIDVIDAFVTNNWWNINKRTLEVLDYQNYYEWINKNIVRYLLVVYENSLRSEKGFPLISLEEYFTQNNREKLSIEHITAKKAKKIKYTKKFEERYLNSLGNLVIDYAASNSSKGAKNTADKVKSYNLAPVMSQNEIDKRKVKWDNLKDISTFIENREEKLFKYFVKQLKLN